MARKIRKEDVPFFWIKSGSETSNDSIHSTHNNETEHKPAKKAEKLMYTSSNAAKAGLREGWIRATFIVREENLKKLKALAYWDRKGIKDILDEALQSYLKDKNLPSEPPQ
jgi:hypothetical protein